MKIISWNCNMAFRKKWQKILDKKPDLLVIQECENIARLKIGEILPKPKDILWIGNKETKGVGILSYNGFKIHLHKLYTEEFKYIIPIQVSGKENFLLFAVWAMPHKTNSSKGYVGQIWNALQYYESILNNKTIIVGDFNSNVKWDYMRKKGNHTDLVNFLNEKDVVSVYHNLTNLKHGHEEDPTLFLLKQLNKPYHIDYCFVSKILLSHNSEIEIGKPENWIKLSDHMPLTVTIN